MLLGFEVASEPFAQAARKSAVGQREDLGLVELDELAEKVVQARELGAKEDGCDRAGAR